jgi:diketogulonate reductase-like aldo/keto reductase
MDLYLIHAPWPWSHVGKDCEKGNIEVWRALIDLYNQKYIRSIGVSNFEVKHLENIIKATNFIPHVNQIAVFVGYTEKDIREYCIKHNILVEAYSPLATGRLLNNKVLIDMANKYNVSVARLCIRYCLELNTLPLPKSTHRQRIEENIDLDFKISQEDMELLNNIK